MTYIGRTLLSKISLYAAASRFLFTKLEMRGPNYENEAKAEVPKTAVL